MKPVFKSAGILVVFISFVMYTCGLHVYFLVKLAQIKHENLITIEERETDGDLVKLAIPLAEIIWVDEHEIGWNGNMYDLAETFVRGNILFCLAYHDMEEEDLSEEYSKRYTNEKRNSSGSSSQSNSIQPFLATAYLSLTAYRSDFDISSSSAAFELSGYTAFTFLPPEV